MKNLMYAQFFSLWPENKARVFRLKNPWPRMRNIAHTNNAPFMNVFMLTHFPLENALD